MEHPWFYGALNNFQSEYGLQKESPETTLGQWRNLLMCSHRELEQRDCVKMFLSELQSYYQKAVGEDAANCTWKRETWRRLFKVPPPGREVDRENEGDNDTFGSGASKKDNSRISSSGSNSDKD